MANGLLDFLKTPEGQGLLAATFGGLAGARRGTPLNNLGRAGLAGLSGYGGALERQDMVAERQKAQQLRDLKLKQAQQAMEQQQRDRQLYGQLTQPQVSEPQVSFDDFGRPVLDRPSVQTTPQFDPATALRQGMSPEAVKRLSEIEAMSKPKREVYKPGDVVYENGRQAFAVPTAPEKPPTSFQEYMLAQQNPEFAAYQERLKRAGATQVPVTIGQEKAEAKKVGEFFGEQYSNIQSAGFQAQRTIDRFNRLGQLLEGVNTGKFTDFGLEVAKTAAAAGINIDPNMPNKEAARALSSEMALQLRNPAGGAGMPGALSDKDREFLQQMTPNLATTPEGRNMMIDTAKKLAERDKVIARMAREYRQKRGSLDEGFYEMLSEYSAKNPLFEGGMKSSGSVRFLGFE